MTEFPSNILAQLAGIAPGFDRFGPVRRVDAALPFYGAGPSTGVLPDGLPDIRLFEDRAAVVLKGQRRGSLLSEELFRSAVARERRRADRFDEGFALVTVAIGRQPAAAVASAMRVAARETDVVGWLEPGRILGVILAEVSPSSVGAVRRFDDRLRLELARRVDASAADGVQIDWYVHSAPGAEGTLGLSDADPFLDDLRSAEERRTVLDGLKRALDVLGSLTLLVLLAPVLLVLAALVKLTSRGPILFRQVRVGQLAKPFIMLKFRTMQVDNDSGLHRHFVTQFIKSSEQLKQPGADPFFKIRNDPRVTPIGHLLRRTSLDELPQLWNVLRGDMSLVGPRPPLRYELEAYRPWHWRRVLEAKPGITGLWQVTGRSRTTFDEMVRLDLRYVRTRNLWTDVRILLATPRAVVTGKGAC
ncbi:MAG TPA: sugar transferase [Vicinamibacterales bacterium]|nr:sugar transferase [Vicinamibacterales bacterium]